MHVVPDSGIATFIAYAMQVPDPAPEIARAILDRRTITDDSVSDKKTSGV